MLISTYPDVGLLPQILTTIVKNYPEYCDYYNTCTPKDLVAGVPPSYVVNTGDVEGYFLANLFKKVQNLPVGIDPDAKAKEQFTSLMEDLAAENRNLIELLSSLDNQPIARILFLARSECHRAFRGFNQTTLVPRFTLGATSQIKRSESVFARIKCMTGLEVDTKHGIYSPSLLTRLPRSNVSREPTGVVKLDVVPKTAKISRIIGKHDTGIMPLQNGMGDYITHVLKRHCDIDLATAPTIHKQMAMDCSLGEQYATIDKSNASDRLLRKLVEFLIPEHMFSYMSDITPTRVELDGSVFSVPMMCPAGNGFLFPLQTFIYWALAESLCKYRNIDAKVYAFGDDILIHKDVAKSYIKLVEALGLKVNKDKSFLDGPFYESCGGDFLFGQNVRPYYVSKIPRSDSDTHTLFSLVNGIRRVCYYNNSGNWVSDRASSLWAGLVQLIPKEYRFYGPRHYGDSCINTCETDLYNVRSGAARDTKDRPYASERIKILTEQSIYSTTVADELKGVPGRFLIQALLEPSVKGSGLLYSEKKQAYYYPLMFQAKASVYKPQWVPYTLNGQAPNDIDDLFALLESNNNPIVRSKDVSIRIYNAKLIIQRRNLIEVLRAFAEKQRSVTVGVLSDRLSLDF